MFIEGALIIAEENGGTLDYIVNEDGSCTCKLCGELTQVQTGFYNIQTQLKCALNLHLICIVKVLIGHQI